jgi:hypothetical protein
MTSERLVALVGLTLALAALTASTAGCADFSRGPEAVPVDGGAGEGGTANPDGAATFAAVEAILISGCQRCHSAGGEAGDTAFLLTGNAGDDFATASLFVDPNAPSSSRLLTKMSGSGHGGGTVFGTGTPEYQTVSSWIQEGAPQ